MSPRGEVSVIVPEGVGPGEAFAIAVDADEEPTAEQEDSEDGSEADPFADLEAGLGRTTSELDATDAEADGDEDEGQTMAVECPEGVSAGELILISTEAGEELEVEVPEGIGPGDTFEILVG